MVSKGMHYTCSMIEIGIDNVDEIKTKKDFFNAIISSGEDLNRSSLKSILCNINERKWNKYLIKLGFKKVGKYIGNHFDGKGKPRPVYTYMLTVGKKVRNDYTRSINKEYKNIGFN